MKYIYAQPAIQYFAWQIDIVLASHKKIGTRMDDIHIISATYDEIDPYFDKLIRKYPGVLFVFYPDKREYRDYIPSIKQHLAHQHWQNHPELENEVIVFMDADTMMVAPIDFSRILNDDVWWMSDTVSYLGYDYIVSKGRRVIEKMCDIADIEEGLVRQNQNNSGGAQYVMKNVPTDYWEEVVGLSHRLYAEMQDTIQPLSSDPPDYVKLQIWTSEMWALLWVAWKRGIKTGVAEELNFCWATDPVDKWSEVSIFHNAGVVEATDDLFFKGNYINTLPSTNIDLKNTRCSSKYYNFLSETLK